MASETRFYKGPTGDAYKTAWDPTERQKELAAKFGLGSPEHKADNQRYGIDYSQEDKYRLQLWMEEAQLGSLDNLDTDDQSFEGAKVAADDFKEFSSQNDQGDFTWNNGTFTPETITAVTQGITEAGSDWEGQTGRNYDHLRQDPYVYEQTDQTTQGNIFDIPRSVTHGLQEKADGKETGGYITYGGLEGIPDHIAETYENKYIDELWGTDDAVAGTEGYGRLAEDRWDDTDSALWGLDLVRTETDLEIGSEEHYEHITRGEVNWAHYRDNATFNRAYNELAGEKGWGTAGELTGQGDIIDQVHRIREVNDLIFSAGPEPDLQEHGWAAWHKNDWEFEAASDNYRMVESPDGTDARLYKGNEMQIDFTELMDINSPYYVAPGTSAKFKVGVDPDTGEDIMKEFTSPIEKDLSHLIYDPNKQDQTKDHYSYEYKEKDPETGEMVVRQGQFIEGQAQKLRDVSTTPNLPGISWSSGKPKLINPIKLKTAPVIRPISNVTYAQTEGGE